MNKLEKQLNMVKTQLETGLTARNEYKDSYLHKALVYLREVLDMLHEEDKKGENYAIIQNAEECNL